MILFLFVGNNCNVFAVKMYYRKDKPMSATSAFYDGKLPSSSFGCFRLFLSFIYIYFALRIKKN